MNKSIEVSIVICTYNRGDIIGESLENLAKQDYPLEKCEIIIVDNYSTDNTPNVVKNYINSHPSLTVNYFLEEKQGAASARNRGMLEAKGEIVACIDDDGLARPDWLRKLLDVFKQFKADVVCGEVKLEFRAKKPYWMVKRFYGWLSSFQPLKAEPYTITSGPWPVGCNMAFRREIFWSAGGFNPELGRRGDLLLAAEETVLFMKLIEMDKKIYIAPTATVNHIVKSDRLRKSYFIKIQKGLMLTRFLHYYRTLSFNKRAILFIKTILELTANAVFLFFALFSIRYWFLAYLYFYRSVWKLTVITRHKLFKYLE